MKASEKLAKATREALNSSPKVAEIIAAAGDNAEQMKQAMYDILWVTAILNDENLLREIEGEAFADTMERIG